MEKKKGHISDVFSRSFIGDIQSYLASVHRVILVNKRLLTPI